MSKVKFDLRVRARRGEEPRQATVENAASSTDHWDESYVDFSGFFGDLGPHVFAAAPDMLAALTMLRDADDLGKPDGQNFMGKAMRVVVDAAIAKAEGQS